MFNIYIFVIFILLFVKSSYQQTPSESNKILETDIKTLVLNKDCLTTGRRSGPVKQLQCVSNCPTNPLANVACTNTGTGDNGKPIWKCESNDMPKGMRFGDMAVSCEGYDNSADVFVLKGSCQLRYALLGNQLYDSTVPYNEKGKMDSTDFSWTVFFIIAGVLISIIIITCIIVSYEKNVSKMKSIKCGLEVLTGFGQ